MTKSDFFNTERIQHQFRLSHQLAPTILEKAYSPCYTQGHISFMAYSRELSPLQSTSGSGGRPADFYQIYANPRLALVQSSACKSQVNMLCYTGPFRVLGSTFMSFKKSVILAAFLAKPLTCSIKRNRMQGDILLPPQWGTVRHGKSCVAAAGLNKCEQLSLS